MNISHITIADIIIIIRILTSIDIVLLCNIVISSLTIMNIIVILINNRTSS